MHMEREPGSIPPFRPIVSSIGTYNYNLSKYLCGLLTPHRTYKINNTWAGFHKDINYLTQILKKNLFPTYLIERVINLNVTRVESEVSSVVVFLELLQILC